MKVIGFTKQHLFSVFAGVLLAGNVGASSVQVPCGSEETGLNDCTEVKDRSIDLVTKRSKEVVEDWYRGKDFYSRTCSLTPTIFNPQSEISSNHQGQSCGEWSRINTTYKVVKDDFSVRVDSYSSVDSSGSRGDRERAYTAGAYVQAVDCMLKQVIRDIRSGSLDVKACESLGRKTGQKVTEFVSSLKNFSSHIEGSNARAILNKCQSSVQGGKDSEQVQAESLDQLNCRLLSQRGATEALFQQLAVCELMLRSQTAFERFKLDALNPSDIRKRVDGWAKACQSCGPDADCQNTCYQSKYTEFFKGKIHQFFGQCG